MPQKPLDYRSTFAEAPNGKANKAAGVVAAVMLGVNVAMICLVLLAPHLGYAIALLGVPLVNLSLALVSLGCTPLGCTPLVLRFTGRGSLKGHIMVSITVPIALAVADVIVFSRIVFPHGVGH